MMKRVFDDPKRAVTKTSRVLRGLTPVIFLGLLTLRSTDSAHAGQWKVSYLPVLPPMPGMPLGTKTGTSSGFRSDLPNGPSQPAQIVDTVRWDWFTNQYTDPSINLAAANASQGSVNTQSVKGAGEAKMEGDVQILWTWETTTNEPVKPFIDFLLSAQTSATAIHKTNSPQRFAETGSASITCEGLTISTTEIHDNLSSRWSAGGSRLFHWPTGGVSPVRGPILRLLTQANIPDNRESSIYVGPTTFYVPSAWQNFPDAGSTSVTGSISAKEDNRSLSLSRAGAPTPKQKGAPGVTINEANDE